MCALRRPSCQSTLSKVSLPVEMWNSYREWQSMANIVNKEERVANLQEQFGQIDIYLFDQILRGRIAPGLRIFDAGCGSRRNLVYFLREGYEVFGVDADPRMIEGIHRLAASLAPSLPKENFRAEAIEASSFP